MPLLPDAQLSADELDAARQVAACDHSHAALLENATRIRAFIEMHFRSLDPATLIGVTCLEATLFADLGRVPALDARQVRAKAELFARRPRVRDNLGAMLLASLEQDAERLGLSPGRSLCAHCGRIA